jgi:hypothetical protein
LSRVLLAGAAGLMAAFLTGCSDLDRAKHSGGTATIELPPGKKLSMATWEDDSDIWYLVRDRRPDEPIEKWELKQKMGDSGTSGTVVFVEK